MRGSRIWATVLMSVACSGGIVFTTIDSIAGTAQESTLDAAKAHARQAPTNAEASLVYGRALRRAGLDSEALVELRRGQAFAKGETATTFGWEIARTHIAKRDFAPAMAACRSIAKLRDGNASSHVCAAEAHLLWRRGTEALAELAEVEKTPNAGADARFYAKVAEGRARELASNDREADAAYNDAIRLGPNRVEGHLYLGMMLRRLGKDALPSLRRAADLDPNDPIAQLELGRALADDPNHRAEAIAALERATSESQARATPWMTEGLRVLAETYLTSNRLSDAKRTADALSRLAPNDVHAWMIVGRVALAEARFDDAVAAGETAVKLMPNEGKAKLLVADAYAKKGEIDLALEAYQKASGLDPLDPTPLVNATNACVAAGRLTSAKAFGARASADFPDYAPAWVAEGDALVADGNPKAARHAYESAKKAKGADVATIDKKLSRLQ